MKNKSRFDEIMEAIRVHLDDVDGLQTWASDHLTMFDDELMEQVDRFAKLTQEPRRFQVALALFELLAFASAQLSNTAWRVKSLLHWGELLERLCILDEALDCYEQALVVVKEANLGDSQEALCLNHIASIYQRVQLHRQALPLLERALEIDKVNGDLPEISKSKGNLASAYHGLGQYERALELHREALTGLKIPDMILGDLLPTAKSLAIELLNTGLTYVELGQDEQALGCFRESLVAFRRAGRHPNFDEYGGSVGFFMAMMSAGGKDQMPSPFIQHEVTVLVNIARCAKKMGRTEEAGAARDEAASLVQRYGLQDLVGHVRALYQEEKKA